MVLGTSANFYLIQSTAGTGGRSSEHKSFEPLLYTVSRPLTHVGLVIAFLCVATGIYYLPELHGNCGSAHQPKGTCKKTVAKPTWSGHGILNFCAIDQFQLTFVGLTWLPLPGGRGGRRPGARR